MAGFGNALRQGTSDRIMVIGMSAILGLATISMPVHAVTVTWTGGTSGGNWGTASNWSSGSVPGGTDDVSISSVYDPHSVISGFSYPTHSCNNLTISSAALSYSPSFTCKGDLTLTDANLKGAGSLGVAGSVTISGSCTLQDQGTGAYGVLSATSFTIGSSDTISLHNGVLTTGIVTNGHQILSTGGNSTVSKINNQAGTNNAVIAQAGTLTVGSGENYAALTANSSATLDIGGGGTSTPLNLNTGSSISGAGTINVQGVVNVKATTAVDSASTFNVISGGTLDIVTGGGLSANFSNAGTVNYSGGTMAGNITNQSGGTFQVTGGSALTLTGNFTNNSGATLKVGSVSQPGTSFTVTGTYTNNGTYTSDPAANFFNNLVQGSTGKLIGGQGDSFHIKGDFQNNSIQNTTWSTSQAALYFEGGPTHNFALAGQDEGSSVTGYLNNFAWGSVSLASGETLTLQDGRSTPGSALYTRDFFMADGINGINEIHGNGQNIYYDATDLANAYLSEQTYALIGGGHLAPVFGTDAILGPPLPEPGTLIPLGLSLLGLALHQKYHR